MLSAELAALVTNAARKAGLEPASLLAVVEVESGGRTHATVGGRREPVIRFEGHYFDRRLSGERRETARREGLASPQAGAVRNPPGQAARWRLLERAAAIDRKAAYEATSWGIGQVMGGHWAWLGYDSVEALVETARSGPAGQLELMLRFIDKAGLREALSRRDWAGFARGYNGPGFARNSYHIKLSLAYRRYRRLEGAAGSVPFLRRGDRGEGVRHLQTLLGAHGHPVAADGVFGSRTEEAVQAFQRRLDLAGDGVVGPRTREALEHVPLGGAGSALGRLLEVLRRRTVG